MSTDDPRGLNPTDGSTAARDRTRAFNELSEAIDALERVDFRQVPRFSTSEAAALHARLREARDELGERTPARPAGEGL